MSILHVRSIRSSKAARATLPAVIAVTGLLLSGPTAQAASYTYDANTGTAGAQDGAGLGWNTSNLNWLLNGTGSDVAWPNLIADTAVFGAAPAGTGGTVTVGTVNVGTIQFNPQTTTGYTLTGGNITLGAGGITTTSTVNTTISSKISGTNGLLFNGVATLANGVSIGAASTNDYTGITTLSTGGRLSVATGTPLGSSVGANASTLGGNHTVINAGTTLGITATSTAEAFVINGTGSTPSGNPNGAIRFAATMTLSSLVQVGSNSQITSNGSGIVTLAGNLDVGAFNLGVGNGTLAFNAGGKELVVSGVLAGTSAGILDVGAGGGSNLVNLTNASNTFAGTVRVNASSGTSFVGLANDTALGSGASTNILAFNGGGVQSTSSAARTIANPFTINGNANFGQTTVQTGTFNFTYNTAPVSMGNTTKTFTTNVDTTFATAFSSTGTSGSLSKAGASTLFLNNAASTYTGATTINAGILNVASLANGGSNSAIGAGAATVGLLNFGGGTLQYTGATAQSTNRLFTLNTGGGTLDASGSVVGATVSFTGTGALNTGSGATARTLTLTGSNLGVNSLASTLGTGTSIISLAKTGNGTWALSGANTYDGGTTVSGGTLLVNNTTGSGTGTGAVNVNGGTLGGTGALTGTVAVNTGATLSPGASIESLATGSVSLNTSSTLTYEAQDISATGADLLDITGNLNLTGTVTLNLVKLGAGTWNNGDKLTLASYTGTESGQFTYLGSPVADDSAITFDGVSWTFDYNDTVKGANFSSEASGQYVTITAVIPEPATLGLIGLASTGLLAGRRRRTTR